MDDPAIVPVAEKSPRDHHGFSNSSQPTVKPRWPSVSRLVIGYPSLRPLSARTSGPVAVTDPRHCIELLARPAVQTYSAVKRKLTHCDSLWIQQFLDLDGLGGLLQSLEGLCENKEGASFTNAFLQVLCVGSIKAVMNSQTGLDYIIENRQDFTRKLAKGKNIITHHCCYTYA